MRADNKAALGRQQSIDHFCVLVFQRFEMLIPGQAIIDAS